MTTPAVTLAARIRDREFSIPLGVAADQRQAHRHTLPAAYSGTLTTRTSDHVGIVTYAAQPPYDEDDPLFLFWAGGWKSCAPTAAPGATTMAIGPGLLGLGIVLPPLGTAITFSDPQRALPLAPYDRPQIPLLPMPAAAPPLLLLIHATARCLLQIDSTFMGEIPANTPWVYSAAMAHPAEFDGDPLTALAFANAAAAEATVTILAAS